MQYYISVEKNIDGFKFYEKLWKKRGISGIMATSMSECIRKAVSINNSNADELYFIDIVADDIKYLPQLTVLDDEVDCPILIATSKYDEDEHDEAIRRGADYYGTYRDDPKKNISMVMNVINGYNRIKRSKGASTVLANDTVLLSSSRRVVFVNDEEVELTKIEFDLLHHFMDNRGQALSYEDIYVHVWEDKYNDTFKMAIKTAIKKLRKKITNDENENSLIENIRGHGYKMPL